MNLKCDTKVCSEIEKFSLSFNIEPIYDPKATATQRDHGSCFIIGFGDVRVEIVVQIISILVLTRSFLGHIPLSLYHFTLKSIHHQVIYYLQRPNCIVWLKISTIYA